MAMESKPIECRLLVRHLSSAAHLEQLLLGAGARICDQHLVIGVFFVVLVQN